MRLRALLTVAALAAAGCASVRRDAEAAAVADGRYAEALASYEAHVAEGGSEVALDRNLAGTAALLAGDVPRAHRHFAEAFADLEDLTATTGDTVTAFVGPDRTKAWKGDPYERVMNAYYLGVTYWLLGDPDNAAASFKSALLRDADSAEGIAQADFGALWFLLAHAQIAARHTDGGADALRRARTLLPANPYTDAAVSAGANVVVVFETGSAPRKVATGAHGSQLAILPGAPTALCARVAAGGREVGRTVTAADLHHQAVTRGGKFMDDLNTGKAVTKDAALVAGGIVLHNADTTSEHLLGFGLLAVALLLPAETDLRQWDTLPGEIQVLAARLPPGDHTLAIEPLDGDGRPVPGWSRVVPVTVREGRTTFLWTRAAPLPRVSATMDPVPGGAP